MSDYVNVLFKQYKEAPFGNDSFSASLSTELKFKKKTLAARII
jgi:hypothetical protein